MQIGEAAGSGAGQSASGFAGRLEFGIGRVVEWVAGWLVVVEMSILFAGVISRYVFKKPFTWTDELASILFLWLAMLGAVLAYRRSEHMRMAALVNSARPSVQAVLEALALAAGLAFLGLVMWPSLEYAIDEIMIVTPALEIPNVWRAAALPVGVGLMLVLGLTRIARTHTLRDVIVAFAIVVVIGGALWLGKPVLNSIGNYKLIVFFVLLVGGAVLAGVPIVFAFGIGTFAFLALTTRTPLTVVVSRMDEGMSHIILLSVPLFVFLGLLIEITGMARAMVDFLASLIGHFRGGLKYVLLGAMYLVSGISGSKAADMAAVAPVLFPEMKKRGAQGGDLVALLSSSGAMSETIPPSLVLITIGAVTGVSISALFTGGLLPAVVGMAALCVVVYFQSRREDMSGIAKASGAQVRRALVVALPALALPFVIRTVVVEGVATATEVSTVGVAYTVLAGLLVYRQFDWRRVLPMLVETASLSGAILLIIGCATAMAWALTQSGFSNSMVALMSGVPGGKLGFMVASLLAFVVLGSVLEGIPAIVLFGPLLFPVARALGVHEVHYAMVVIFAMGLGLFAPPFGVGFYAACAIGKVPPDQAFARVWPHLGALFVALLVIAAVPWISIGFL